MHLINPKVVTPESEMIRALVTQHVDDTSADFAILATANNFKDHVKSYFSGAVGSALAYLAMIADGYVWSDHFENIGGGNPLATRSPDFVFARPGSSDVALMESKGTRSKAAAAFDSDVKDGYVGQVEPHLGHVVGTGTATHGYCIGSHLTSTRKAQFNIHYTDAVTAASPSGTPGGSVAAVQQNNYATAFLLAHSESLSRQIRAGDLDEEIPFYQFEWMGRQWLSSGLINGIWFPDDERSRYFDALRNYVRHAAKSYWHRMEFAVERTCAETVLKALSSSREPGTPFDLLPLHPAVIDDVRAEGGGADTAVFPDGLAVAIKGFPAHEYSKTLVWSRKERAFRPFV